MESFLNREGGVVVAAVIRTIQDNAAALSEIDGAIGDGDHGINMSKGFAMSGERLAGKSFDLSEGLAEVGKVLIGEIGGAMGPLYGTFFREMAKASKGHESIDAPLFETMLDKAAGGVLALGNAHVGDKTLVDTLSPALDAFRAEATAGRPFTQALSAMAAAAERGKESTRDLVAKVGRASRLGERSRGVLDAGAVSCWLILKSMADSMRGLLEKGSATP
jgi:dihydroxyacetone kinase-like protein